MQASIFLTAFFAFFLEAAWIRTTSCPIPPVGNSPLSLFTRNRMAKRVDRTAQKITDLFLSNQVKGNEYSICIKIASMWNLLISNFRSSGNSTSINLLRQQRLQSILLFIYAHYADDLQLSDLAASANISVGECCRIFQNILHTTPYGYLTNYRIQTSVSLPSPRSAHLTDCRTGRIQPGQQLHRHIQTDHWLHTGTVPEMSTYQKPDIPSS